MKKKHCPVLISALIFSLAISGCADAKSNELSSDIQKKYGNDAYYFLGLKSKDDGDSKTAIKHFQKSVSSKSKLISNLSAEELISLHSGKNALSLAREFYRKHGSDESLVAYLKQLFEMNQYDKIISLTKKIDYAETADEIIFYNCAALLASKDDSFPGIYNLWCISKPYSEYHGAIYSMLDDYPDNSFAFASDCAKMLNLSSKKDWGQASTYAKRMLSDKKNLTPTVASAAGKSLFYGSQNYESNAEFLESILTGKNEIDFFLNFYIGRMYSRIDGAKEKTQDYFKRAMDCASDDENYDNALWYYLNFLQQNDLSLAVTETENYCSKWHDPNYFDDFLEPVSVLLLDEKKWEDYYRLTKAIEKNASPEARSKFSYVCASLIENDFYRIDEKTRDEEIKRLYKQALDGGSDSYHKLLAAAKLNLSDDETWKLFSRWNEEKDFQCNEEVEKIFYGYIDFDLHEKIYPFWLEHSKEISLECAESLAEYLSTKTDIDSYYNYIALRIAARKMNYSEKELDRKIIELSFPRGFSDSVEKYSGEYKVDDHLIYALIRMESFFSPNAISHAGAVGLCQLMESTAADIAKKLGQTDYDLVEPDTNIQFGTNYISELISRLENSSVLAICSYNAGIGKIRSTLKSCLSSLKRREIPNDIFLEMLNITETRNYGRNVTAAAAIYAYLYNGQSLTGTARKIMGI